MTKIVMAVLADSDPHKASELASAPDLIQACTAAGADRLQTNTPDPAFAAAMSLQEMTAPVVAAVSVWCNDEQVAAVTAAVQEALTSRGLTGHAWLVEETVPLEAPILGNGERHPGLANLAFLRRPEAMPYDEWREYWQGTHTQIALDTQDTFGYVQNRVLAPATAEAPAVAAIVEELFPEAGVTDIHAFYGSGGDKAELHRRLEALMASVAKFGASEHLDLVPTARRVWQLS